jgi:GTP-binding protein HflX
VVDGSHNDPEGQIGAVREVLAEIGADSVPELVVINKADVADPMVVSRLRAREPHSVVVSARTGEGVADVLAALEYDLPHPGVEIEALVPYSRGDLMNRVHEYGEVLGLEHDRRGHRDQGPRQRRTSPETSAPSSSPEASGPPQAVRACG